MRSTTKTRGARRFDMRAIGALGIFAFVNASFAIEACSFDAVGEGAPAISDDAGDANVDTGLHADTGARDSGLDSADANDAADAADAADSSDGANDTGAVTPDAGSPDASSPDASPSDGGHDAAVLDAGAHDAGLG